MIRCCPDTDHMLIAGGDGTLLTMAKASKVRLWLKKNKFRQGKACFIACFFRVLGNILLDHTINDNPVRHIMVKIIKTVITPNPGHGVSQNYTLLDQMSREEYHQEICTLSVSAMSADHY